MPYFPPRAANTTLKCPNCNHNLDITRSCKEVHMHCPACKKDYPLDKFIAQADDAMEKFLENVYFDRI